MEERELETETRQGFRKEVTGTWGCSSGGRVLSQHAQSPKFNPQHPINRVWLCTSGRTSLWMQSSEMQKFKVTISYEAQESPDIIKQQKRNDGNTSPGIFYCVLFNPKKDGEVKGRARANTHTCAEWSSAACSQTGVDCLFQIFWTEADHGRVQGLCISAKLKTCPQPLACRLGLDFCALLVSKHLGEDQLRHRVRKRSEKHDLFAQARIWTTLHRNGVSELGFLTDSLSRNLKEKTTTQPFRVNLQISRDVGLKMFRKSEL